MEGDRLLARDIVGGNVERAGWVRGTVNRGPGRDYMVIQYGDDPFLEGFIYAPGDVVAMLPDPEDLEQLAQWPESGAFSR